MVGIQEMDHERRKVPRRARDFERRSEQQPDSVVEMNGVSPLVRMVPNNVVLHGAGSRGNRAYI